MNTRSLLVSTLLAATAATTFSTPAYSADRPEQDAPFRQVSVYATHNDSNGLGFGPGIGVQTEAQIGKKFHLSIGGKYTEEAKRDIGEGHVTGANIALGTVFDTPLGEWYGRGGYTFSQTTNPEFEKTGAAPFVELGKWNEDYLVGLRYSGNDGTENDATAYSAFVRLFHKRTALMFEYGRSDFTSGGQTLSGDFITIGGGIRLNW